MSRHRILLTGSAGFIGRHLLARLSAQHEIFSPEIPEFDLVDTGQVDSLFREDGPFDFVIHCATVPTHRAAVPIEDPAGKNLRMYFNLARNKPRWGKLILLTSGAVYDVESELREVSEEAFGQRVPREPNGFSKFVEASHAALLGDTVELRPFGVFGKHELYRIRFISNAICKALFRLPITLRQNRRFSYVCIDDLVTVVERFLERGWSETAYNVTPGPGVELRALAELVRRTTGTDVPIRIEREGLGLEYTGCGTRLERELSGVRFTPLEESIAALVAWYAEKKSAISREDLVVDL